MVDSFTLQDCKSIKDGWLRMICSVMSLQVETWHLRRTHLIYRRCSSIGAVIIFDRATKKTVLCAFGCGRVPSTLCSRFLSLGQEMNKKKKTCREFLTHSSFRTSIDLKNTAQQEEFLSLQAQTSSRWC